ncbi:hypothetical protein ROHU_020833 [Labeo rohita]|uniref:Uncharacterized protein n=1 Tax=Labeo rohita TaxID=84645 RepID=A0A498N3Q9_LABRO|nr:hypothetical protein ROHU_020833 [Labeo rohita]
MPIDGVIPNIIFSVDVADGKVAMAVLTDVVVTNLFSFEVGATAVVNASVDFPNTTSAVLSKEVVFGAVVDNSKPSSAALCDGMVPDVISSTEVVAKVDVETNIVLAVVATSPVVTGCMAFEVVLVSIGDVEIDVISKVTDPSALVMVLEATDKIPFVLTEGVFSEISCSAVVVGRVVIIEEVAMVVSTGIEETKVVVANGVVETDVVSSKFVEVFTADVDTLVAILSAEVAAFELDSVSVADVAGVVFNTVPADSVVLIEVSTVDVEKGKALAVVATGCMEMTSDVALVSIEDVKMDVISEVTNASALVIVVEVPMKCLAG